MAIENLPGNSVQITELLEKNLEMTQEIFKMTKSIKSYLLWQRVYGFIKFVIIIVPLVLGVIYLPPILKNLFGQYQGLLDLIKNPSASGFNAGNIKPIDLNSLPPEIRKLIK